MKTRHDAVWERVNALLDERRDPLGDPEVSAALAADVELGREVLALARGLRGLAPRRPRALHGALALIGLAACAAAAYGVLARGDRGAGTGTLAAAPANESRGAGASGSFEPRVLALRAEVTVHEGGALRLVRTRAYQDGETTSRSRTSDKVVTTVETRRPAPPGEPR